MDTYTMFASNSSMCRSSSSSSSCCSYSAVYHPSVMQRASTDTMRAERRRRSQQCEPLSKTLTAPVNPLLLGKFDVERMPTITRKHPLRDAAAQSTIFTNIAAPVPASCAPASAKRTKERGLQRIVGGLYLAYEDETMPFDSAVPEELRTESGLTFTHVVNLSPRAPRGVDAWPVRSVDGAGATRLTVPIPEWSWAQRAPRSRQCQHSDEELLKLQSRLAPIREMSLGELRGMLNADTSGEGMPALTTEQMIEARDFLATSGYDMTRHSEIAEVDLTERLLITCPKGRETEAIAVLVCYVSLVTGFCAEEILECYDEADEIGEAWQGVISAREEEWIDELAQMD